MCLPTADSVIVSAAAMSAFDEPSAITASASLPWCEGVERAGTDGVEKVLDDLGIDDGPAETTTSGARDRRDSPLARPGGPAGHRRNRYRDRLVSGYRQELTTSRTGRTRRGLDQDCDGLASIHPAPMVTAAWVSFPCSVQANTTPG